MFETNCIFEYKPSPHFRLDVVYKMGGRINGTLRYKLEACEIAFFETCALAVLSNVLPYFTDLPVSSSL